jgi:chorismate mutase
VRAIRGATTVEADSPDQIEARTKELVLAMAERNGLAEEDVISAFFTATPDIRSLNPATGARRLGWTDVPLIGLAELDIDNMLPLCIRIMFHVETELSRSEVEHVFLHGATVLRPDLVARSVAAHSSDATSSGEAVARG